MELNRALGLEFVFISIGTHARSTRSENPQILTGPKHQPRELGRLRGGISQTGRQKSVRQRSEQSEGEINRSVKTILSRVSTLEKKVVTRHLRSLDVIPGTTGLLSTIVIPFLTRISLSFLKTGEMIEKSLLFWVERDVERHQMARRQSECDRREDRVKRESSGRFDCLRCTEYGGIRTAAQNRLFLGPTESCNWES
jgi:hypothetical protein